MQMVLAITAVGAPGFIEHRIMVGFSGIEHLLWQQLVLTGVLTEMPTGRRRLLTSCGMY